MERRQLHSSPEAGHIKQRIEGSRELGVFEKPLQVLRTTAAEASPPPQFEAEVALKVVLTDLTIDLAIGRDFLIGVLFDQTLLDVGRQVWACRGKAGPTHEMKTRTYLPNRGLRPTIYLEVEGIRDRLERDVFHEGIRAEYQQLFGVQDSRLRH